MRREARGWVIKVSLLGSGLVLFYSEDLALVGGCEHVRGVSLLGIGQNASEDGCILAVSGSLLGSRQLCELRVVL